MRPFRISPGQCIVLAVLLCRRDVVIALILGMGVALSAPVASSPQVGNWKIVRTDDPLHDRVDMLAILMSDQDMKNIIGRSEKSAIAISCGRRKSNVALSVLWAPYVSTHGYHRAEWRFDDMPIQSSEYAVVASNSGNILGKFYESAMSSGITAAKLYIGIEGQSTSFSLDGFAQALRLVSESC
jgi:hypothetical protein